MDLRMVMKTSMAKAVLDHENGLQLHSRGLIELLGEADHDRHLLVITMAVQMDQVLLIKAVAKCSSSNASQAADKSTSPPPP